MSPLGLGTILITGGGSRRGIGRATALRFAADGYAVAVLDIDGQAAADTADEAAKAGSPQTFAAHVDVTDEQSVQAAVRAAEAAMPPVTVLARESTAATISARGLSVRSVLLGDFVAHPRAVTRLEEPVDVLIVATKAAGLPMGDEHAALKRWYDSVSARASMAA